MWTASNKAHSGSALMMPSRASLTLLDMKFSGSSNHIGIGVFPDAKGREEPYRRAVSRCTWSGGVD
jgi:hypothetical protein